jgi:hypothetical protein
MVEVIFVILLKYISEATVIITTKMMKAIVLNYKKLSNTIVAQGGGAQILIIIANIVTKFVTSPQLRLSFRGAQLQHSNSSQPTSLLCPQNAITKFWDFNR